MIVLLAVSAAVSAFVYARFQAPVYRSVARVEVSARFDNGQQLALERLLPQLAQRVRTTDVAREVDSRLRLDLGVEAILGKLRAEPVAQSGQILIEADDVDPGRAESIVFATASVFEEQHAARNQGIPSQDRAIVSLLDRPTSARLVWPQTRAIVAAAALLGMLAGAVLAFGIDYLDDTLKTAADVERSLGLTTLAHIPAGAPLLIGELRPASGPSVARVGEEPGG